MNNTKLSVSKGMASCGDAMVPAVMGSVMRQLLCTRKLLKNNEVVAFDPENGEVAMDRALVPLILVLTPLRVRLEEKK